jgi:hypothetical protein
MELDSSVRHNTDNSAYEYPIADEKEASKVAQQALQYRLFNKTPVPFPEPHQPEFTFIAIPLNNTSFPRRRESSQNGGHEWWFIARRLAFTLAGYQPSLV